MTKLIQIVLLVLVAAACGAAVLYFFLEPRPPVVDGSESGFRSLAKTEAEVRDRLAEFRMQRLKLVNAIKGLEIEKQKTLDHLKSKGIESSADLDNNDADARFALMAFNRLVSDIKSREDDVKVYDEAIASLGAQLDDLRRKYLNDSATLSEREYMDLQKHIVDVRERLLGDVDIFQEAELRKTLDEELTKEKDANRKN
jgi:hypothetical protein